MTLRMILTRDGAFGLTFVHLALRAGTLFYSVPAVDPPGTFELFQRDRAPYPGEYILG